MHQRPRILGLLAWFMVLTAFSLPAQAMWIYGHGVDELQAVFEKLTVMNWLIFVGLVAAAVSLWQASPYVRWILPPLFGLVAFNNFIVGYYSTDFSPLAANLATVGFVACSSSVLVNRTTRYLLSNPHMRWWKSRKRKRIEIPVAIEGTRLSSIKATTFDISESGVFIPEISSISVGDHVELRMSCSDLVQFRCQGRVVRRVKATGRYPSGVGVQFLGISLQQKRELRRLMERQAEVAFH